MDIPKLVEMVQAAMIRVAESAEDLKRADSAQNSANCEHLNAMSALAKLKTQLKEALDLV